MHDWIRYQLPENFHWSVNWIAFLAVLGVAFVSYWLTKAVILRVVKAFIGKTKSDWDDLLFESRFFSRLSHFVPAALIGYGAVWAFEEDALGGAIMSLSHVYMLAMGLLAAFSALNVSERIYQRFPVSQKVPIKGFLQVAKIILFIAGAILMISTIAGRSPFVILGGFGALTAVLMLVFKDPILGLVGGIQLTANDMVRKGDWIEMPKFGADGNVIDVALTTVKVQNFDKTISTIPTYSLISDSFRNWRGMADSGVRRIKRNLVLDVNSIGFLTEEQLQHLDQVSLLKGYLAEKTKEIAEWNAERKNAPGHRINARALTNLGTFRAYVREYLRSHPKIDQENTLLVRQLQPSPQGLPIELYVFTNDNRWIEFEGIQSDIFDHLYAILPEFGLRAFQAPAGSDVQAIIQGLGESH